MPSDASIALLRPALRRSDRAAWLALIAGLAVVAVVVAYYGLHYHIRQNDETSAVWTGRLYHGTFPHGLTGPVAYDPRGPERMVALVWLVVSAVFSSTPAQFQAAHVVMAVAWASGGIPVFLLARQIGVPNPYTVLAALLAVGGPFAIFGVTLLNTTPGFVTLTWATWAMVRTVVRPSLVNDALFLVVAGLALVARVGHAPFLVAIVPAVLVQTWRDTPRAAVAISLRRGGPRLDRVKRALGRLAWTHPLLIVVAFNALVVIEVRGRTGLVGNYGAAVVSPDFTLHGLFEEAQVTLSRAATGTGFLPVLIGLPWMVREALRPRRCEAGALAIIGLGFLVAYSYAYYTAAVPEDRYVCVLAPVLVLALVRALVAREIALVATGVFAVLTALAIHHVGLYPNNAPDAYFVGTGAAFFKLVVLQRLDSVLPVGASATLVAVLVVLVALAIAVAVLVRLPRRRSIELAPAAILLALAVYGALAAGFVMHKYAQPGTKGRQTFAEQSFADAVAGPRPQHAMLTEGNGDPYVQTLFFDVSYYNRSLTQTLVREGTESIFGCCIPNTRPSLVVRIDPATGRLTELAGAALPPYEVQSRQWLAWSPAGDVVAQGQDPLDMLRLDQPSSAAFEWLPTPGLLVDGWTAGTQIARLRTYTAPADGKRPCLSGLATGPDTLPPGGSTATVAARGDRAEVRLRAHEPVPFSVPLRAGGTTIVRLAASAVGPLVDGRAVGVRLTGLDVGPCR